MVPRRDTGLGSREPLVTTFCQLIYITLFYMCFCLKTPYLIYIIDSLALNSQPTVAGQGFGPKPVCLGPVVVCGFLTWCRKDFTTRVQVTVRIHLLKLGQWNKGGIGIEEATGEPRQESEKRGLGDRFRGLALDKLRYFFCFLFFETGRKADLKKGDMLVGMENRQLN